MTEKQKFYRLLSLVCEDLPTGAINAAIGAGYYEDGGVQGGPLPATGSSTS